MSVGRHLRVLNALVNVMAATNEAMSALLDDLEAEAIAENFASPSESPPPFAPSEVDTLSTSLAFPPVAFPPIAAKKRSSSKMNAITPDRFVVYLRRIAQRATTENEKRRVLEIVKTSREKRLLKDVDADDILAMLGC